MWITVWRKKLSRKKTAMRQRALEQDRSGKLVIAMWLALEFDVELDIAIGVCKELRDSGEIDKFYVRTTKGWEI